MILWKKETNLSITSRIIWQQHFDHQLVMIFQNVINRLTIAQYMG